MGQQLNTQRHQQQQHQQQQQQQHNNLPSPQHQNGFGQAAAPAPMPMVGQGFPNDFNAAHNQGPSLGNGGAVGNLGQAAPWGGGQANVHDQKQTGAQPGNSNGGFNIGRRDNEIQ